MELLWTVQLAVVLLTPSAIYAYRHRKDRERAAKGAGLTLALTFILVFGAFIAGETVFEVGGWEAGGLIAMWLVPLVGLSLLAWYRPGPARIVLAGLVALAGAVYVWSAFDLAAWRGFEDIRGPLRGMISFALVGPIAVLGWKKPRTGATLLLVLAALPVVVVLAAVFISGGPEGWPLLIVSAPAAVIGVLYLVSVPMSKSKRAQSRQGWVGAPAGGRR